MRPQLRGLSSVFFGLIAWGSRARAQEPLELSAPAEPPPEAVEVVARERAPQRPVDYTRSRALFEASVHRSGSDLMRTIPGVFVTQHSGEGKAHQIFFRGFDTVHGQDLELTVAGVPVNEVSNVHGQGYADLHFVIPEVVQRLHALPGAYDASQGDFAVAGSLRYELGYPYAGVTTKVSAGSFGARRAFLAYHPEGAPTETFAAADLYETDGFGVARRAERANAMLQWREAVSRTLSLRLMASTHAGRFDSAGVIRPRDVRAGIVDRLGSYDPEQGGASTRSQLALELQHAAADVEVTATPFIVRRGLRLQSNFTGALINPTFGDNTTQVSDSTTYGFTSRLERQLPLVSEQDRLTAGLFARHDAIAQRQLYTAATETDIDAVIAATDVAGYLDLAVRVVPRVVLHAGLRVDALAYTVDDHVNDVQRDAQGHHLGPKAMADIGIADGWVAFIGYGEGFRSPQARSVGDGEQTPFTEVTTLEAGTRFSQERRLAVALSGYASTLQNDLVFDPTTSRNDPAPATRRLGVALDFSAEQSDRFLSTCGGSYTRATFTESDARYQAGEILPFVPQWVLRCDLSTRSPLGSMLDRSVFLRIGAGFNALLDRPLPFGERGSDVFLIDSMVQLEYGAAELRLDVQNLLDRQWNDGEFVYASQFENVPLSAVPQRHVTVGAPRSFLATLRLQF